MEQNTIIQNLRVLTEEFIPSRILHRDSQLSTLRNNLSPLISEGKPRNSFMFGPPGTGKTTLSNYIAEELKKEIPLRFAYVNCWNSFTRYSIIYTILKSFGEFVQRKGTPTDELIDLFNRKTQESQCLIVLDEVDRLEEHEILYDLIQAGVGILLISNSENALYKVDPRIRSRLSSTDNIQFYKYTDSEIIDILKDRREWGLIPGVLSNEQIEKISLMSNGDARTALGILSSSAQKAEDQDLNKIPDSIIENSLPATMSSSKRTALEDLNDHQRLIINILKSGNKRTGEIFNELNKVSKQKSLGEIADRTFRKHMEKLVNDNLVCFEGEGRWRIYSLPAC